MKYYLFRDLDHEANLNGGKTFHASGVVLNVAHDKEIHSGKELAVIFYNPFTSSVERAWRSHKEVEKFEVEDYEHDDCKYALCFIETKC